MSAEKKAKPSAQIIRFCRMVELLAGHEFEPMRMADVARALGVSQPEALRALRNAQAAGWAEQTPDGLWRLAPRKITNIAVAVQHGIQRARTRLEDDANNYTRSIY